MQQTSIRQLQLGGKTLSSLQIANTSPCEDSVKKLEVSRSKKLKISANRTIYIGAYSRKITLLTPLYMM